MMNKTSIIEEFSRIVGNDRVLSTKSQLLSYTQNSLGFDKAEEYILLVLKPLNTEEVMQIVEIANKNIISLYPISTGMNWGYGSKIPTAKNSVILDLSGMNKIREFNKEAGYVVIEPGVTQDMLALYLKEHSAKFIMDKTGTPGRTSIIGNVLERGWGLRGCRDQFTNGFEVITGSGEKIRTGSWGQVGEAYFRYDNGPLTDHLFVQSNLGIITAMSFKLIPRPEQVNCLIGEVSRENISAYMEIIQRICAEDNQNPYFKMLYSSKYFSSESSPLYIIAPIFGKKNLVNIRTKNLIESLGSIAKLTLKENISSNPEGVVPEDDILSFFHPDSTSEIDVTSYMFSAFDQVTTPSFENIDQLADFGLTFYDLILPFEIKKLETTLTYLSKIIDKKYNLSRRTTVHVYDPNILVVVNYIVFNKQDKDEVKRASDCVQELYGNKNLLPQRLTPWSMSRNTNNRNLLLGIKKVFDPNNIISPGRYIY